VADETEIPIAARGLSGAEIEAALTGADLHLEARSGTSRSFDMDPATASLVVGIVTAAPKVIEAVATAWGKFKKRRDGRAAPATVVVETEAAEIVIRVSAEGKLTNENGEPLGEDALPSSPKQIVRIHLS
jgi:hypothetical protein